MALDLSTKYSQFSTNLDGFRGLVFRNLNKTLKRNEMFYELLCGTGLEGSKGSDSMDIQEGSMQIRFAGLTLAGSGNTPITIREW